MGRPSTFTAELADKICAQLAAGLSLRAVCREEGMPPEVTVRRWVVDDVQGFAAQYARARDMGLDAMADELVAIADTPQIGTKSVSKATGLEITEGDMVEHRRLQVDARKWYLSKLAPKRYGDKQQVEHSGAIDVAQTILAARKRSGG
jgi:hypothetical protein